MSALEKIEGLAKRYEGNATLRSLVQLIPMGLGSAVDTAITARLNAIKVKRAREFFDELAKSEGILTPELLESDDFLHCYSITMEAVLRTSRAEKIHTLARLLSNTTDKGTFSEIDEYEEFLGILSNLSSRELSILIILDQFESNYPYLENENDLQRANRFWDDFLHQLESDIGIKPEEINAILIRLIRSGCYELFVGSYYGYTGGKGKITPLFKRLKEIVL